MRILLFIFILISRHIIAQCGLRDIDLSVKINHSVLIIEGKVIDQHCFYNKQRTFIYTSHTIEVYKLFKGDLYSDTIHVITQGGIIDNLMISVHPSVEMQMNDVGIFMLEPSSLNSNVTDRAMYQFYGGAQGFFKYNLKNKTATVPFHRYADIKIQLYNFISAQVNKTYTSTGTFSLDSIKIIPAFKLRAPPIITTFSPALISAGTDSVITIQGFGFGSSRGNSTVGFKNADDGGNTFIEPVSNQYVYWSNNQIQVKVPDNAGSGEIYVNVMNDTVISSNSLTINFAQLNVTKNDVANKTYLRGLNAERGITWRMNYLFENNTAAKEAFARALSTWSCASLVNWKIGATTNMNSANYDSVNVVAYDENNQLSDGTLAACYNYWYSCEGTYWISAEMDMIVRKSTNWEFGPETPSAEEYDFESVILHELGHGMQLAHVINTNDVMNFSIQNGSTKRSLNACNIAASSDMIKRSNTQYYCSSNPINTIDPANCNDVYAKNNSSNYIIFPNPTEGFISIAVPEQIQHFNIYCYNMYGGKIKTYNIQEVSYFVSIDLSELANGMYFLVMESEGQTVTHKIIITHIR